MSVQPLTKAVFLDRDGTINQDRGYLYKREDFVFLPGAPEGMALLQNAGYLLVIVTNQSGIARGYYTEADYRLLNDWMLSELAGRGVRVAKTYCCPHHPEAAVPAYRAECDCRKPKPGLFYQAAAELCLDLDQCVAIGDRSRDLAPCLVSRCRGYLLGEEEIPAACGDRVVRASSLWEAAQKIFEKSVLR